MVGVDREIRLPGTLPRMNERLRYPELAPEGIAAMRGLEHYLNATTALPAVLLELVRLRASLLNGCGFCVGHHTKELQKHNEPETRIKALREWETSDAFTLRERAALAWTDALTDIQRSHASDAEYEAVSAFFHEKDLVDLTLAIAGINAWNRMSLAFAVPWDPSRASRTMQQDTGAGDSSLAAAGNAEAGQKVGAQPAAPSHGSAGSQAETTAVHGDEPTRDAVDDDGGKVAQD